jgi:8-oxo-dGTP pyrophosphatase MutT (NUDIX family)
VHSGAMSASLRSPQVRRASDVRLAAAIQQPAANFVRLAQLQKLRNCEQAAAVCYRVRNGGIEFLLVRTRSVRQRGGGRWTFPKGKAEPGLTHAQVAALEAFEEAGVHGRIEEAAFTCYVRLNGDAERKSSARSPRRKLAVNAHLCEVLRLGHPKESNRNRTWFWVEDAKLRLREGRGKKDGAEFARVIDRAVARIRQLCSGASVVADRFQEERSPQNGPQQNRPPLALQNDALQKVQFDFADGYGRSGEASFMPLIRRIARVRRYDRAVGLDRRELLRGEVLQFSLPRERKAKALGVGIKNT